VKKEGAVKLVIGGGSQPAMWQEEFEELRKTVEEQCNQPGGYYRVQCAGRDFKQG
jgi:hypothetical protein